jgi:hypothetical protein
MLKMNLITQDELYRGLYGEVCWELSGELWGEVYMELYWELSWGLGWGLYGELGIPIRANFSLSKISRV